MNVLCFGDSLTYGAYDRDGGGWADRMRARGFARAEPICVFNLGIGGETTREMVTPIVPESDARLERHGQNVVLLAYGLNDLASIDGAPRTPIGEYIANLSWVVDRLRERSCDVFFLDITPVAEVGRDLASSGGPVRTNVQVAAYNEALETAAGKMSVPLIDVHRAIRIDRDLSSDGLHLNSSGHSVLCHAVEDRSRPGPP